MNKQNPSTRRKSRFLAACLAVLLLLTLCASVPTWIFARLDNQLFTGTQPLQRQVGRLAPAAEDIYLVRALHRRTTLQQQEPVPGEMASITPQEVIQDFFALYEKGVISSDILELLQRKLLDEGASVEQAADGTGFVLVHCTMENALLFYEKEGATGLITRCWNNGFNFVGDVTTLQPPQALDGYLRYLGLTTVTDWQYEKSFYAAAKTSENAHLMAFYGGELEFGVLPL